MRITLERIKGTNAGKRWSALRAQRLVLILGEGWYWKRSRCGYTDMKASAGISTLEDALNASGHCGEEKHIVYEFLPLGEGEVTQESGGPARLLLTRYARKINEQTRYVEATGHHRSGGYHTRGSVTVNEGEDRPGGSPDQAE